GVGAAATQSFTLTVVQAPAFGNGPATSPTLVGASYSFQYTSTGFPVPSFTVSSGALPTGLTLSSSGVISGTPTATGSFSGVVTLSKGVTPDATQAFTIVVNQTPAFTSTDNTSFAVGTAGNFTVTASGVPAPTLTRSGTLPAGVTFDTSTGILSGTPTAG